MLQFTYSKCPCLVRGSPYFIVYYFFFYVLFVYRVLLLLFFYIYLFNYILPIFRRPFTWGVGLLSSTVAVSSLIIHNMFRQRFKLGGLGRIKTYIPVVGISSLMSLGIHEFGIKHKILLGQEGCPLCISLRSSAFQVGIGLVYPYIMSILTCLPLAREYYTLPMPDKGGGKGAYLRLFRQVRPAPLPMLFLGITHAILGIKIANSEMKVFHKHLSHSPSLSEMPIDMPVNKL